MSSILIKNAEYLVTMNKKREILRNVSCLIENQQIKEIPTRKNQADKIIDASGMIVLPGFINTHLHTPQVFHRHCPAQQNKPIDEWIEITTSINREIDEEAMYYGALVCFAELISSGVTTTADYFYPFPKRREKNIFSTIKAALDIGIRLTSIRGSMSVGQKDGSRYADDIVETSQEILHRSEDFIKKAHNSSPYSQIRAGVCPCLPFASTEDDFRQVAKLARKYPRVILQTHIAESLWEVNYIKEKFGVTPIKLMKKTGFLGSDVGLTHCNVCSQEDVELLAKTKTNVILTPVCNTRNVADDNLIAPLDQMMKKKINISIGTDGPASNDSLNFLEEMRYLRVVSAGKLGMNYLMPSKVFDIGLLGGAITLNRNDIGGIEPQKAADLVIFNPEKKLEHAGAVNKWAALISCQAIKPEYVIINGRIILEKEEIKTINISKILTKFLEAHSKIIERAQKKLKRNLYEYSSWEKAFWKR